jgi:hypothetical protein
MAQCHAMVICVDLEHRLHRGALRYAQLAALHLLVVALRLFYFVFCTVGQMGTCALAAGQGTVVAFGGHGCVDACRLFGGGCGLR